MDSNVVYAESRDLDDPTFFKLDNRAIEATCLADAIPQRAPGRHRNEGTA